MTRYTKVLGLAIVAVLALSAVVASAAQAANGKLTIETTGKYPANINAENEAGHSAVLSNGIRSVTCANETFTGTLAAASETIEVTPAYASCTANGGVPATVTVNGCKYLLSTTGATVGGTTPVDAKITGCTNANKSIEVHIYASAAKHAANEPLCTLSIREAKNTTVEGLKATNINAGTGDGASITFDIASANVNVTRILGNAANCGTEEQAAGTLNGLAVATAQAESNGEAVGLMVS